MNTTPKFADSNQPSKPTGRVSILKRQNAEGNLENFMQVVESTNPAPSTPQSTNSPAVRFPVPASEQHASSKRRKLGECEYKTPSSPYKATTQFKESGEPHTLVSTCGTGTFERICQKGPHAGRAYITCSCPRDGAFIWKDTWLDKFKGNPTATITCRSHEQQTTASNKQPTSDLAASINELQACVLELEESLNETRSAYNELHQEFSTAINQIFGRVEALESKT